MSLTPEQLESLIKKHKHKGDLTSILIDYLIKTSPDYNQGDILYVDSNKTIQRLTAGTSGRFLKTQGANANPIWATIASALDDLSDVVITTPAVGALLYYDGANWIDSLLNLNDLNDVVITSPTDKTVIAYDSGSGNYIDTDTVHIRLIQDAYGKIVAHFNAPAGVAVINFFQLLASITLNDIKIIADGGDANISIQLVPKGTGNIKIGTALLKFPNSDGNANNVLKTDGAGNLSFALVTTLAFPGTQVASGVDPSAGWTTLSLASVVGANSALVLLRITGNATATIRFRKNGDTTIAIAKGANTVDISTNNGAYAVCVTDSSGVVEWISTTSISGNVWVEAYLKL